MRMFWSVLWLVIFVYTLGCSGSSINDPTSPLVSDENSGITQSSPQAESESFENNRYLWGYYEFRYDPETNTCDMVPVRQTSGHWNALKWLETAPCTDCVSVEGISTTPEGTKIFDVRITHPFDNPNVTGFDVRGIAMFERMDYFPEIGVQVPNRHYGTGELVNPDGHTSLYGYWTWGFDLTGLTSYYDGVMANQSHLLSSLSGYKRHISGDPGSNPRNAFYAGDSIVESYEIDMPDTTFVFGYAVDASWAPPITTPVTDPQIDFGPDANAPEPWKIEVFIDPIGDGLTDMGGSVVLTIDVYEHNSDTESHLAPVLECPDLFMGSITADFIESNNFYARYMATVPNQTAAEIGTYRLLVSVEDEENDSSPVHIDLRAFQVVNLAVTEGNQSGWVRAWGDDGADRVNDVDADDDGNIFVVGEYRGTVDFDPGPGKDNHTEEYDAGCFLVKYDPNGDYQWGLTWGGGGDDIAEGVAVDADGSIYVVGSYRYGIDLDPDPDESFNSLAVNGTEGFVSKFDQTGDFLWGNFIGGTDYDEALDVACNGSGDAWVVGYVTDGAHFSSGPINLDANGRVDCFVARYDSGGTVEWVGMWGGDLMDCANDVAVNADGDAYVVGYFRDWDDGSSVDFDTDEVAIYPQHSNGTADSFLSKFHPDGTYLWSKTWGGAGLDYCESVAVTLTGDVYVCGDFEQTVDLDPGPGDAEYTVVGAWDACLIKFQSNGDTLWAKGWGGPEGDTAMAVDGNILGDAYVTGYFGATVDFDAGGAVVERKSNGGRDAFTLKYYSAGGFHWVQTVGGASSEGGEGIAVGEWVHPYAGGYFNDVVNFAPPSEPPFEETSTGLTDAFLLRYLHSGEWH